tara:strand:- start:224 stop:535 length:312 start_codon:yes stop_codon:yes gene_type:complete
MSEKWKTGLLSALALSLLRNKKALHKQRKLKKLNDIAQGISKTMTLTPADMNTLMGFIKQNQHCKTRRLKPVNTRPMKGSTLKKYGRYNQPAVQHDGLTFGIS